jgi:hypothetical protein
MPCVLNGVMAMKQAYTHLQHFENCASAIFANRIKKKKRSPKSYFNFSSFLRLLAFPQKKLQTPFVVNSCPFKVNRDPSFSFPAINSSIEKVKLLLQL